MIWILSQDFQNFDGLQLVVDQAVDTLVAGVEAGVAVEAEAAE